VHLGGHPYAVAVNTLTGTGELARVHLGEVPAQPLWPDDLGRPALVTRAWDGPLVWGLTHAHAAIVHGRTQIVATYSALDGWARVHSVRHNQATLDYNDRRPVGPGAQVLYGAFGAPALGVYDNYLWIYCAHAREMRLLEFWRPAET
jgi:hypothetical protein